MPPTEALTAMGYVTAIEMETVLGQWQAGLVDAAAVQQWAEARYLVERWEPESNAVNLVLAKLDDLGMDLVVLEDVPALRLALRSPDCAGTLHAYFAAVDIAARKSQLAGDPFYARFCI